MSAIGDVCHTVPVVRTLQETYPGCQLTWIIGSREAELVGDLPGIEFIRFDKSAGWHSYPRLHRELRSRRFDVLLHLQNSWRTNGASLLLRAPVRLGFAVEQTHDAQWCFTNQRIPPTGRRHVLDMFFAFLEYLGIHQRTLRWDIPIAAPVEAWARQVIPDDTPTMIVSPCANPRFRNYRNWRAERYGAIAHYASEQYGLRVLITGGTSEVENHYAQTIRKMAPDALDLCGRTSLKELLALLGRATFLLCPDSGPAHMATAVGTPVIGLFATTNPDRARPYFSGEWCVNCYPEALQRYLNKTVAEVPWGTRVRNPAAMDLITTERVSDMMDRLMASPRPTPG